MKYSQFLEANGVTDEQIQQLLQINMFNTNKVDVDMVLKYMQLLLTRAYIKINNPPKAQKYMKQLQKKFPEHTEEMNQHIVEARMTTELFEEAYCVYECLRDASAAWNRGYDDTSLESTYAAAEVGGF